MSVLYETTTPAPAPLAVLASYTLPGGTLTAGHRITITTVWGVPDAGPKALIVLFGACVAFAEVRTENEYGPSVRVTTTILGDGLSVSSIVGPVDGRPRGRSVAPGAPCAENLANDVAIVVVGAVPVAGSLTLTSFKVELL